MRGLDIRQTDDGLKLFCDCGSISVLIGGDPGEVHASDGTAERGVIHVPAAGGEVALTCPGCGTAHWLTFNPRQAGGG